MVEPRAARADRALNEHEGKGWRMTEPAEDEEEETARRVRRRCARQDPDGRTEEGGWRSVLRMLGREKGSGRQVAAVGGAKADAFPGFINPTHS